MRMFLITVLSSFIIFGSCGNQVIDENRLLAVEVMAVHDEAMAKMGYMHELKLGLKEKGKDLSKGEVAAAIDSLQKAHKAMMEWMRSYKPPKTDAEFESARNYLLEEKEKITEVGRLINESIEQAEKLTPLE